MMVGFSETMQDRTQGNNNFTILKENGHELLHPVKVFSK
jgi:hypothetical protein